MREKRSFQASWIRVTREGVVKYEDNVLIVERGGKILYKFLNMRVLQVYNRIEGYLTFYSSSTPQGRNFPGYGEGPLSSLVNNSYIIGLSNRPTKDWIWNCLLHSDNC